MFKFIRNNVEDIVREAWEEASARPDFFDHVYELSQKYQSEAATDNGPTISEYRNDPNVKLIPVDVKFFKTPRGLYVESSKVTVERAKAELAEGLGHQISRCLREMYAEPPYEHKALGERIEYSIRTIYAGQALPNEWPEPLSPPDLEPKLSGKRPHLKIVPRNPTSPEPLPAEIPSASTARLALGLGKDLVIAAGAVAVAVGPWSSDSERVEGIGVKTVWVPVRVKEDAEEDSENANIDSGVEVKEWNGEHYLPGSWFLKMFEEDDDKEYFSTPERDQSESAQPVIISQNGGDEAQQNTSGAQDESQGAEAQPAVDGAEATAEAPTEEPVIAPVSPTGESAIALDGVSAQTVRGPSLEEIGEAIRVAKYRLSLEVEKLFGIHEVGGSGDKLTDELRTAIIEFVKVAEEELERLKPYREYLREAEERDPKDRDIMELIRQHHIIKGMVSRVASLIEKEKKGSLGKDIIFVTLNHNLYGMLRRMYDLVGTDKEIDPQKEEALVDALKNAIDNAIKYGLGREVYCKVYKSEDGKSIIFIVGDRGDGIDPKIMALFGETGVRDVLRHPDIDGTGRGMESIFEYVNNRLGGRVKLISVTKDAEGQRWEVVGVQDGLKMVISGVEKTAEPTGTVVRFAIPVDNLIGPALPKPPPPLQ